MNPAGVEGGSGFMGNAIVETRCGKAEGRHNGRCWVWKGIPYARPPLGDLRFRPPEPPVRWEGVRDATRFSPVAPQTSKDPGGLGMSEDCLYLNVWSPGADDRRRPVMVWIHGGAFIGGSGAEPTYDGSSFCEAGDLVFVTFNYRLGALGFLQLGEIGGEAYAASGNNGILDQAAALRWVRDNIERFGGDPERVTVFGQSAGAGSVAALMAMLSAQGLFHRAILQSAAMDYVHSLGAAARTARILLEGLNLSGDVMSALKAMPAAELTQRAEKIVRRHGLRFFPVVDGIALPRHPAEALADGAAREVPVMVGATSDEMALMHLSDPGWEQAFSDERSAVEWFIHRFGPFPERAVPFYLQRPSREAEVTRNLIQLVSDRIFWTSALRIAESRVNHHAPVWMYRFHWQSPAMDGKLGACHAMELPFVFNTIGNPSARRMLGDSPPARLAEQMHKAWIAFARGGDPNTPDIPEWPAYELDHRPTMIFGERTELIPDPNREERLVWS
ncbi:carboxylesterase/lipase family protein [Cohnella caldifontis]|uniref:carboxylesterase/lipase family protein n=1 Tax=Cohnella caldifontis TaxID=3027471 RepID=UPI0023EA92E7|nr:carboxylesterase/lipase family protein [Cohnella sp. YIM B05605]